MFLIAFPLLLVPFTLYNMVVFLLNMTFTDTMFTLPLPSQRRFPVTTGDLLVVIAMLLLYLEVLKAARFGTKVIMDHVLSLALFVAMVAEFVLVPQATTPTFMFLAVLGFVDLITGISVSARRTRSDIVLEGADPRRESYSP
jgi:hypothetical protein